jgi:hypothetical protein
MSIVPPADHLDDRLFLLFISSALRYRPSLPLVRSRRIDIPSKDHDASDLRDIAHGPGSLVIRDWIRRDRGRWIMVASSRIGCERRPRHFECECWRS